MAIRDVQADEVVIGGVVYKACPPEKYPGFDYAIITEDDFYVELEQIASMFNMTELPECPVVTKKPTFETPLALRGWLDNVKQTQKRLEQEAFDELEIKLKERSKDN